MNMTTVATSPFISANEILFPETVSGKMKSGALVPSETITEGILAML
jgi:hypothetical protein